MSDAGLRVALLHPAFWPEVRRGGERYTRDLADQLLRLGHRPHLITSHPGRPSTTVEDGLPVTRLWRPPERRLRRAGFDDYLSHVPFTYAALLRGRFDVAHALYPTDALAAIRWGRRTGRPALLSYLGVANSTPRRRDATRRAVPRCTAVTAMSAYAAERLEEETGARVRVLYPGVDVDRFAPRPRAKDPVIYFPGDPGQRRKRARGLIEALPLVRRVHPRVRCAITRPRDPALASELAAADPAVEIIDVAADTELAARYGSAWVTALPSIGEAFGLVLIESMAAGTPVVGPDRDAFREIVDRPEVGRLFAGDGAAALGEALIEALALAADPRTAAACRRRAVDFSLERFGEANVSLYRSALDAVRS